MNSLTFSAALPSSGAFKLMDGVYNSLDVTPFNCGDQPGEGSTLGINLTGTEDRDSFKIQYAVLVYGLKLFVS